LLFKVYNNSLSLLLMTIYSDYKWLPWRFSHVPNGYWSDMQNQKQFIDWAGKQLNFVNREDWYKATTEVQIQGSI
jgi:hypothetical protein